MDQQKHKYKDLMEYLRREIQGGVYPEGGKIPSENELSERLKLSRFTVRRAIELLTNEGLLEKRHGSGTYVKEGYSAKQPSRVMGVVTTYFDDYIFPAIISGIDEVLTAEGYTISLSLTGNKTEKEAACLNALLQSQIDGLILEGTKSALPNPNIGLVREFIKRGVPIVFINSVYPGIAASYVLMDDHKSGILAADCLIGHGHTRIGGIFKSDDLQGHHRYKGFVDACHRQGLILDENRIFWYATEDLELLFSPDYEGLLLKRLADCTGVVCYNDQIAVRLMELMRRNGRAVPEELSVVSFDNSSLSASMRLTSVAHAKAELGRLAAKALVKAAGSPGRLTRKILAPELVQRESVRSLF